MSIHLATEMKTCFITKHKTSPEFFTKESLFPANGLRTVTKYFASGWQGEFLELTIGRSGVMAVMSFGSRNELSLLEYVSINVMAVIVSWQ